MGTRNLTLSVCRNPKAVDENAAQVVEPVSQQFKKIKPELLKSGRHRCHYCDYFCEQFQQVTNIDGDHENLDPQNLKTVCIYCHQCHHLGQSVGGVKSSLILFEPKQQSWINRLARYYFIAKLTPGNETAQKIINTYERVLNEGKANIKRVMGKKVNGIDVTDSLWLANYLLDLEESAYRQRDIWPSPYINLRLAPELDKDEDRIKYWRQTLGPVSDWSLSLVDSKMRATI